MIWSYDFNITQPLRRGQAKRVDPGERILKIDCYAKVLGHCFYSGITTRFLCCLEFSRFIMGFWALFILKKVIHHSSYTNNIEIVSKGSEQLYRKVESSFYNVKDGKKDMQKSWNIWQTVIIWTMSCALLLALIPITLIDSRVDNVQARPLDHHNSYRDKGYLPIRELRPVPPLIGPKHYYLALGDSLAFSYQPTGDYNHGYVEDFYTNLQDHGTHTVINYGCSGESTGTMIQGGCPDARLRKSAYQGSQLDAAVDFIQQHQGQVSPVTIDMGINDIGRAVNDQTCAVDRALFEQRMDQMDYNMSHFILPRLVQALTVNGHRTGDLLVLNYYEPFQNRCPDVVPYTQTVNDHISHDLDVTTYQFATMIDIFNAFGGTYTPNPHLCSYTWACRYGDVHATDRGYQVMANAIERRTGY